jgi:glycosyltransferase involved in cell wall biosynthesis
MQNLGGRLFVLPIQCNLFPKLRDDNCPMKVAYYMPFKPMGHNNPSGDLITGTELFNDLQSRGHNIELASRLRCRWIYYKPFSLIKLARERNRISKEPPLTRPDLWLSYHSYYKAPDLLGPYCSKRLGIPYLIFQGIYSTKRRRKIHSLPGFLLNRKSLLQADHLFTNKKRDHTNLLRLVTEKKITYIAPGIKPETFNFSAEKRSDLRKRWHISDETVILTAAMMRPGVKTEGLSTVINSCASLQKQGHKVKLVIVGDGSCRHQLEQLSRKQQNLPVIFTGRIPREELFGYYSGADIFAFPGIEESLGMVYLEAQSCGLPVVAHGDWGGGEAVVDSQTGLLSSAANPIEFTQNIKILISDKGLRHKLGNQGSKHVRQQHDIEKNYALLDKKLSGFTGSPAPE